MGNPPGLRGVFGENKVCGLGGGSMESGKFRECGMEVWDGYVGQKTNVTGEVLKIKDVIGILLENVSNKNIF